MKELPPVMELEDIEREFGGDSITSEDCIEDIRRTGPSEISIISKPGYSLRYGRIVKTPYGSICAEIIPTKE